MDHIMKFFKYLLSFFGVGLIILPFYVLFKIDVSQTPVNAQLIPDILQKEYQSRPYVALVTYGDGPPAFFKNQFSLAASAVDKGFDIIYNFRRGHIDDVFYQKNKAILTQPRGAGYWLWKPYFIHKAMQQLPLGSIIVYADSGVIFKHSLSPLLTLLEHHPIVLVGHGSPTPLVKHLKQEAYAAFSPPLKEDILRQQNIWGFFIAVVNTPENQAIIAKWLEVAQHAAALTDTPTDPQVQDPLFESHGHDQSLLSVVVAQHSQNHIIIPRPHLRKDYGIENNHRHPGQEYTSPLFLSAGVPKWLATIVWNNPLFMWIRRLSAA
jgi:hypothetical protein